MLRIWKGQATAFRAAVRKVGEEDWTPLADPSALTEYVSAALPGVHLQPEAEGGRTAARSGPALKICTLGRFALLVDGVAPACGHKSRKRCFELLKALLAFGGRDVSEHRLADALWPDAEADSARRNLKATLHRLREVIGAHNIIVRDGKLTLARARCWVDAWELEAQLDDALGLPPSDAERCVAAVEAALALYQGAFLGSEDLSFALVERERLRNKLLRAITRAVERLAAGGRHEQCVVLLERGVEIDPLDERFYEGLMQAWLAQERRCQALKTYERCARQLHVAFGAKPSRELERLARRAEGTAA